MQPAAQSNANRMQLRNVNYAGRTEKIKSGNESEESVDLDEVIARNKEKVQEQIKVNMAKQLQMVIKDNRLSKKKGVAHRNAQDLNDERVTSLNLKTDLFDIETLKASENFCLKTYKDSYYIGEIRTEKNIREGMGVIVYENGRYYEGFWLKDRRDGKGFEVFSNGNVYIGDYKDGKVRGKGVYKWTNGDSYDGDWHNGMKHGYGLWKDLNINSYVG